PIEDLGEADLELQNGKLIEEAGATVLAREGMRQPREPFAEHLVDVVGAQRVTHGLQGAGVSAGEEEAIVERLECDGPARELALRPLVPVEPHASGERDVRRELHEAEAEVAIEDVEVVLVHEHVASIKREARRFAVGRRPFAPAWPLLDDAEAADLLLRD